VILPTGWVETTLGETIEIVRGVTFAKNQTRDEPLPGYVACLRSGNVQHTLTSRKLIYVPKSVIKSDRTMIRTNDTIVSMSNSYELVGKVAFAGPEHAGRTFGAFLSAFRSKAFYPPFLYHLLRSPQGQSSLRATASQTVNISNISISGLASIVLPLPPLAEQGRIVAKLDTLTARLTRARTELDRVAAMAKKMCATTLAEIYDELCGSAGTLPIRRFITSLDQGWSPKCESHPATDDDNWAVLKTTAIQALRFQPNDNKALPSDLSPRPAIEVRKGDILITRAGPRVRCGVSCLVTDTRPRLMLADKMYRLRYDEQLTDGAFLAYMLNTPQMLEIIDVMKTGISDSGLNLTQEKFLTLPIPNVSMVGQQLVVDKLETAFARANRLEAEAARARALLDRLEAAILARAFRGELVSQDPADEPASALLDRIRADRAAAPTAKRGRRIKQAA